MFRFLTLVGLVALLNLGGFPHTGLSTHAQTDLPRVARLEGTPEAASLHPIVGTWRWDNDVAHPNTHISYGVFHADGT